MLKEMRLNLSDNEKTVPTAACAFPIEQSHKMFYHISITRIFISQRRSNGIFLTDMPNGNLHNFRTKTPHPAALPGQPVKLHCPVLRLHTGE